MFRRLLAPHMLALHVLAVLAVVAAALLGRWQYGAWQQGRDAQSRTLVNAPARPLQAVLSPDQPFPGDAVAQPVRLTGRWLPRSTLYVSDRRQHGRTGVWVVTPVAVCPPEQLAVCGSAPAMLVVRGWASSRAAAPSAPAGAVRVTGWLQPGEGSGISDPDPGDDVIPELRVADAIQHVDQDLYGGYVIGRVLTPLAGADDGTASLSAVAPPSLPAPTVLTSLRNLLYALEWWVFGGFAVYVWWRWCRDELARTGAVPSTS